MKMDPKKVHGHRTKKAASPAVGPMVPKLPGREGDVSVPSPPKIGDSKVAADETYRIVLRCRTKRARD